MRGYNFALKLKILNLHWNSLFCIESAISFWVCIESGIRFLICIEIGINISVCIEIRIKILICIEIRFFLHWNSLKHSRRIFKFENIFFSFSKLKMVRTRMSHIKTSLANKTRLSDKNKYRKTYYCLTLTGSNPMGYRLKSNPNPID